VSIVRNRCLRFIRLLEQNEIRELPLDLAKALFMQNLGLLDDQTVIAYFGQQKVLQKTIVDKVHRYATGTNSFSKIEYSRALMVRRGYFEILGLATIEQRGSKLFFCVNQSRGLVNDVKIRYSPPLPLLESGSDLNECCGEKHGVDFSLSPITLFEGRGLDGNRHENVEGGENRKERESYKEREKFVNGVIEGKSVSTHLSDEHIKLRQQPSEKDLLSLYESICKNNGTSPDLLVSQTLSLEQRDRKEERK